MSLQNHTLSGGISGTMAANGITDCNVETTNQGRDRATLAVAGRLVDAADLIAAHAEVSISDPAGAIQFIGHRQKAPRRGNGSTEGHTIELDGPWQYYLEGIIYKQPMVVPSDSADPDSTLTTVQTAKVVLFQSLPTSGGEPAPVSVRDQIADALDQVSGINYLLGDLPDDLFPPEDEQSQLYIADVIEICLHWCPAVQCRWEYSSGTPTLHFTNGEASTSLFVASAGLASIDVIPRTDLLVGTVAISFLKANTATVDDVTKEWNTVTTQTSTVANGSPRRADILMELRGDQSRFRLSQQSQRLKVRDVPTESDAAFIVWLKKVVPWLANAGTITLGDLEGEAPGTSVVVLEPEDYQTAFPGDTASRATLYGAWNPANPANELLWGTIQPWMHVQAENVTMRVKIASAQLPSPLQPVVDQEIAVRYTWTDGVSKTYRTITEYEDELIPGEPIPAGLAAALHTGFSTLEHEMILGFEDEEVEWEWQPGDLVSVDGRSGTIQTVNRDLRTGRTTVNAGPAQHLGLDDLMTLIRRSRERRKATSTQSRFEGTPEADGTSSPEVLGSTHAPGTTSEGAPSAAATQPFQLVKVSDGPSTAKVFRLKGSTIDSVIPTFSGATADGDDWLVTVSASGYIWAKVTITPTTGAKTATELAIGASVPDNGGGDYHDLIGSYTVSGDTLTVSNLRYGPIPADIFRDWYESTVTFILEWL